MERFVDRKEELKFLNDEYEKKESSLIILYGRRRIGKTSLIKKFGMNKEMLYFLSTEESEEQNREYFKNLVVEYTNDELFSSIRVNNWDILFKTIVNYKTKDKKIIVIDEFQYLGRVSHSFLSVFQRIWDEILKDNNIMVILCGSLINMMESQTLNYISPLYGRRTGQIKMKQISFEHYKDFFDKKMSKFDLMERYAITGGVPKYIENFKGNDDIYESIQKNILNKQSYLYEEPHFLLQGEVVEVGSYFSIIKSIAFGNSKLGNIASNLSISPTSLSKYLQTLINLDILEREVPITETNLEKSKKGHYKIKDNFMAFWFKFIYPNKALLEMGKDSMVMKKIKTNFIDNNVSFVYEDVCREEMWNLNEQGKLGMTFDKIGRWWSGSEEIDIIGIDSTGNDIIFGECKYYKNKVMDVKTFNDLVDKARNVDWKRYTRNEKYILFSINGYSEELKKLATERNDLILA